MASIKVPPKTTTKSKSITTAKTTSRVPSKLEEKRNQLIEKRYALAERRLKIEEQQLKETERALREKHNIKPAQTVQGNKVYNELGLDMLAVATGGTLNPAVMQALGLDRLFAKTADKGINTALGAARSVGSGITSTLKSAANGIGGLFKKDNTDIENAESGDSKEKTTTASAFSNKNSKLIQTKLDTIIGVLHQIKNKEVGGPGEQKKSGFMDWLKDILGGLGKLALAGLGAALLSAAKPYIEKLLSNLLKDFGLGDVLSNLGSKIISDILPGALAGYLLGGPKGALIGGAISLGLSTLKDLIADFKSAFNADENISHGADQYLDKAIRGGLIGAFLKGKFSWKGGLLGAGIGLSIQWLLNQIDNVKNLLNGEPPIVETIGGLSVDTLGAALAGAAFGARWGGMKGALYGAIIGGGIGGITSLFMKFNREMKLAEQGEYEQYSWKKLLGDVGDGVFAGALAGFIVGGPPGALVGAALGALGGPLLGWINNNFARKIAAGAQVDNADKNETNKKSKEDTVRAIQQSLETGAPILAYTDSQITAQKQIRDKYARMNELYLKYVEDGKLNKSALKNIKSEEAKALLELMGSNKSLTQDELFKQMNQELQYAVDNKMGGMTKLTPMHAMSSYNINANNYSPIGLESVSVPITNNLTANHSEQMTYTKQTIDELKNTNKLLTELIEINSKDPNNPNTVNSIFVGGGGTTELETVNYLQGEY